jgi:hypothetical protein
MTTATIPTEPTTTETAAASVEPDLASMFYDKTAPADAGVVDDSVLATPATETGTVALPEKELSASTETAKTAVSTGTETIVKSSDDKGHAAAARRLGSEVVALKQEFKTLAEENRVLKAKLDGTYEAPAEPTAPEIEARAEFKGRETASRAVAEGLFGAEAVKAQVYDDDSPYKTLVQAQPWLHARVAKSAQPTVEAMRVLQEQTFYGKYGTDSSQWVAKIEAELRPKIMDEFKQQSVVPVTGKTAPSVTEARGSGGVSREKSLEELFYGKGPAK